jgi:biotin-dependent carboxylase-like uncharacterized protein
MHAIRIVATGAQTLVQDRGRRGYAHLGVPRSGAFDTRAWQLANRLVGNDGRAAALESLGGGLVVQALGHLTIAVTGAQGQVDVDGRVAGTHTPLHVAAGSHLRLGPPHTGIRYYLAVSGGLSTRPVLGSRSHDTLGNLGPPLVQENQVLATGAERVGHPVVDHVAATPPASTFEVRPGPDAGEGLLQQLVDGQWDLDPQSDRIGVRLRGTPLRGAAHSLPSKPMVLGAVQLPPNGLPIILGPDHPTTGGYPVIAVVTADSMCDVAQWSGGPRRFRRA